MNYREERRLDQAAKAEQDREAKKAAAQAEAVKIEAQARAKAAEEATRAQLASKERRERLRERQARQAERRERRAALRAKAGEHAVDLLIYPIALVAFIMAAPAMASYGNDVYDSLLGAGLPLITELGMWAFAIAVQITRHRHPRRPVWGLQAGVWIFGSVAFALNLIHGLDARWEYGVVMGVVAVSGVVAHQLAVASPRRSRAERDEARITRQAEKKLARARSAAVRQATVEIDVDGGARLVHTPGRYALDGRQLVEAVDLDAPGPIGELELELADLIAAESSRGLDHGDTLESGSVATLDREDVQGESSTPGGVDQTSPAQQKSSGNAHARRGRLGGRQSRSMTELRTELARLVQAGEVDPSSAESIRKGLRCAKGVARTLRDEHVRRR